MLNIKKTRLVLAALAILVLSLNACSSTNSGAGIDQSAPPPPPPELGLDRNNPERTTEYGADRKAETAQAGIGLSF
jgi:predicted small secreted protein